MQPPYGSLMHPRQPSSPCRAYRTLHFALPRKNSRCYLSPTSTPKHLCCPSMRASPSAAANIWLAQCAQIAPHTGWSQHTPDHATKRRPCKTGSCPQSSISSSKAPCPRTPTRQLLRHSTLKQMHKQSLPPTLIVFWACDLHPLTPRSSCFAVERGQPLPS